MSDVEHTRTCRRKISFSFGSRHLASVFAGVGFAGCCGSHQHAHHNSLLYVSSFLLTLQVALVSVALREGVYVGDYNAGHIAAGDTDDNSHPVLVPREVSKIAFGSCT